MNNSLLLLVNEGLLHLLAAITYCDDCQKEVLQSQWDQLTDVNFDVVGEIVTPSRKTVFR